MMQFRAIVPTGVRGGQLVRVNASGAQLNVRIPETNHHGTPIRPGDAFLFEITTQDLAATIVAQKQHLEEQQQLQQKQQKQQLQQQQQQQQGGKKGGNANVGNSNNNAPGGANNNNNNVVSMRIRDDLVPTLIARQDDWDGGNVLGSGGGGGTGGGGSSGGGGSNQKQQQNQNRQAPSSSSNNTSSGGGSGVTRDASGQRLYNGKTPAELGLPKPFTADWTDLGIGVCLGIVLGLSTSLGFVLGILAVTEPLSTASASSVPSVSAVAFRRNSPPSATPFVSIENNHFLMEQVQLQRQRKQHQQDECFAMDNDDIN